MELTRHAQARRPSGARATISHCATTAITRPGICRWARRALAQAGLRIGFVWETSSTRASFFSRIQGLVDGAAAFRMAHEVIGQPFDSAIYCAVDYDLTQADIDGAISNDFTGVRAALYVAAEGQPSYRIGVYGSGLCCGSLVEREIASLSWLAQSTGFAGSRQYAGQRRYDLIQMLPARILGEDGIVLSVIQMPRIRSAMRDCSCSEYEAAQRSVTRAAPSAIRPITAASPKPSRANSASTSSALAGSQDTSRPPEVWGSVSSTRATSLSLSLPALPRSTSWP